MYGFTGRVVVLIAIAACGGGSSNDQIDAPAEDAIGADAPACAQLPSGSLARVALPLLHNGPETYDNAKTGPRVVLKFGPTDYRMWYEAVADNLYTTVGYATSTDGITWTKQGPVMSPSASWEGNEVSPNSIVIEGSTLRLYYHAGGSQLVNRRIGVATSTDGTTWTKSPNPILDLGASGAFDDNQVAEPRVIKLGASSYRMYYTGRKTSDNKTSLGYATSSDGMSFTKQGQLMDTARWGNFWGGAFIVDRGHWHLWRGVTPDNGTTSYLVYASSDDGLVWTDGPSNPVLRTNTDATAADYGLVGDSVSGYVDGSDYRIMYTGFNSNLGGNQGRFEGICMAKVASPCP